VTLPHRPAGREARCGGAGEGRCSIRIADPVLDPVLLTKRTARCPEQLPVSNPSLHVWLDSSIRAFHFGSTDFAPLAVALPALSIFHHHDKDAFLEALPAADFVTTWFFREEWYARSERLRAVATPAAGNDWVARDPSGRLPTHYGSFHGGMIAESLLGLMLHFNRRIPAMLENEQRREWDRNLQFPGRLLRSQRTLIVGYGTIGRACAELLCGLGMQVVGCRRNPVSDCDPDLGIPLVRVDALPAELARADHVVLLMPGGEGSAGAFTREHLRAMKPGAHLYNFGRGTTLREVDLLEALDAGWLAGAGLDVTEREPLPGDSPLWTRPDVFVMPHSSCVYDEYRALHVAELIEHGRDWLAQLSP
jgi:phosphoglycerate dehydrogenase-like enzyme